MESDHSSSAFLPSSKEDKQLLKKTYQRRYQKRYRKEKVRKEIVFSKEEMDTITQSAKKHQHKIAEHIRGCSLAYIKQSRLNPSEGVLKSLRYEIRKIGVNINQMAYRVNVDGAISFDEYQLHDWLKDLEKQIEQHLSQAYDHDQLMEAVKASRLTLDSLHSLFSSDPK